MTHSLLQELLDKQSDMQKTYFPKLQDLSIEEQLLINTRAIIHETVEVERELNWKHWKKPTLVNYDSIANEVVDQFIFLINEINICGMNAVEVFDRTMRKINVNIERQKSGY